MDFFQIAFGGFAPQTDTDAAVKFCLQSLAADDRLPDLVDLFTEGSDYGGIEGEPGWMLERRDDNDPAPGYAAWPAGAKFRAFVDPSDYELAFPESFHSRGEFLAFVHAVVSAYVAHYPARAGTLRPLTRLLQGPAVTA